MPVHEQGGLLGAARPLTSTNYIYIYIIYFLFIYFFFWGGGVVECVIFNCSS